jgi:hypothetical protein
LSVRMASSRGRWDLGLEDSTARTGVYRSAPCSFNRVMVRLRRPGWLRHSAASNRCLRTAGNSRHEPRRFGNPAGERRRWLRRRALFQRLPRPLPGGRPSNCRPPPEAAGGACRRRVRPVVDARHHHLALLVADPHKLRQDRLAWADERRCHRRRVVGLGASVHRRHQVGARHAVRRRRFRVAPARRGHRQDRHREPRDRHLRRDGPPRRP